MVAPQTYAKAQQPSAYDSASMTYFMDLFEWLHELNLIWNVLRVPHSANPPVWMHMHLVYELLTCMCISQSVRP